MAVATTSDAAAVLFAEFESSMADSHGCSLVDRSSCSGARIDFEHVSDRCWRIPKPSWDLCTSALPECKSNQPGPVSETAVVFAGKVFVKLTLVAVARAGVVHNLRVSDVVASLHRNRAWSIRNREIRRVADHVGRCGAVICDVGIDSG